MTAIALVDYGMGNRRSVQKALQQVGARVAVTRDPAEIRSADGIVVPGVGAFPQGMRHLSDLGLHQVLGAAARAGQPVLGICLGMQLLFDSSEELGQTTAGLGLLRGRVTRLQTRPALRVPHIGWNTVTIVRPSPLTKGLPTGSAFYHVHSLAAHPADPADVVATADYGGAFATIVARENVFGVQFHPEKSSADGLALLANFTAVCRAPAYA